MRKKSSIKQVFKTLKFKHSDYPPYTAPEQFGLGIKKCSLLESHEIRYSNTTASEKVENK